MTGILLLTHGRFCEGIVEGVEMLMGEPEKLECLKLCSDDDVMLYRNQVAECIKRLDDGDGVLILTDLLGGSPYNAAASWLNQFSAECITGVNLPMVLEALQAREEMPVRELAEHCIRTAVEGIINVKKHLGLENEG